MDRMEASETIPRHRKELLIGCCAPLLYEALFPVKPSLRLQRQADINVLLLGETIFTYSVAILQ
ncbi:hypothetical protein N7474_005423 [Penicillium riverlandense]|uniref:uncharacterized protein n=1 Tax=Penicillium riverlandense TaxID=1903569 RepID=UPI0025482869|nr:uncharacterized protein N7474_005423 [Penicillium riverlandense]KAJ5819832.1 hypothetical protein N7474_005423 [Penicillium riverlandense]